MEESTNHLERLPDSLVLVILGLVDDVKALCCCSATCRRFASLVPLVDSVQVRAEIVVYASPSLSCRPILKPYYSSSSSAASRPSLAQVLHKFRELRRLRVQLPSRELPAHGGTLLKWRATFGSAIDSCVILCSPGLNDPFGQALPNPADRQRPREAGVPRDERSGLAGNAGDGRCAAAGDAYESTGGDLAGGCYRH